MAGEFCLRARSINVLFPSQANHCEWTLCTGCSVELRQRSTTWTVQVRVRRMKSHVVRLVMRNSAQETSSCERTCPSSTRPASAAVYAVVVWVAVSSSPSSTPVASTAEQTTSVSQHLSATINVVMRWRSVHEPTTTVRRPPCPLLRQSVAADGELGKWFRPSIKTPVRHWLVLRCLQIFIHSVVIVALSHSAGVWAYECSRRYFAASWKLAAF